MPLSKDYIDGYTGTYHAFFDEGGYVFEFNKERMYEQDNIEISLNEFLEKSLEQADLVSKLGILAVDWAMYNANYDFILYNALLF